MRRPALALVSALAASLAGTTPARAQLSNPRLAWQTLETRHFRVHYYQGLRPHAERVAAIGEGIFDRIGRLMGWRPTQVTDVVVTDHTDDANGFATVVPYNTVFLYVTAPEDFTPLGEQDDWLQGLFTHEFTHVAHLDNISGLPALVNAILGKVLPPNNLTPRFILEGIATYSESRHTTGGRLRSSIWDMYLRADALAGRLLTLDQLATGPNRWPHGNLHYLYGSYFFDYVATRFGERTFARIADYYGGQAIPGAINRAIQQATGQTYEQLYPAFVAHLRARYGRQRAAIAAAGLEEGERLTFQGEEVAYPRFVPGTDVVAYASNDGQSHLQLRTVATGPRRDAAARRPRDGEWIGTPAGFAFDRRGARMVLADVGFYRGVYVYRDLYVRQTALRRDGALAASDHVPLTEGGRAAYPDLAPDDDHVVYSVNHRGTQTLYEMSLAERRARQILRVQRFEQAYTPRYSPDGRAVVFSHWRRGGDRDIRLLDRATGAVRDLTRDRATDLQPVFSPDGRYVIFSSDRTGVHNLFACELATGEVRQVTNVVHGAFMPAVSPDGRTLVYVGYHHRGHDLYRLPFDPVRWRDAPPSRPRTGSRLPTPAVPVRTHPYDPWPTLYPRAWLAGIDSDGFGPQLAFQTRGADVVGYHSWGARVAVGLTRGDPSFDFSYGYAGLRPGFRARVYRAVTAANWRVGVSEPAYPVERWGGEAEVSIGFPALFAFQALAFTYEAQHVSPLGGLPFGRYADPNEPATVPPFRGFNAGLRASWRFSRVQRYAYDVSAHEGFEGFVGLHVADRALGSAIGAFDASAAFAGYVPMPWGVDRRRHVLALRVAGGAGLADDGVRGIFAVGGYPSYSFTDFISALVSLSASAGVGLRGYPQFSRVGNQYVLANAEYRFPILQVDRGPTTLPVYLSRVYGSVVFDVGNAFFGPLRFDQLAVGAGFEALADFVFAYYYPYTLRLGLAHGLAGQDATLNGYVLLGAPF